MNRLLVLAMAAVIVSGCATYAPTEMSCLGDTKYERDRIALHLRRSAIKRAKLHARLILAE